MSPGTILGCINGFSFYFLLTYRVKEMNYDMLLRWYSTRDQVTLVGSFADDDSFYEVYYI